MKETMKKNLRFQQIRVISKGGISKYLLFHIFLCGRITLGVDSICIIFEYSAHVHAFLETGHFLFRLKNGWVFDYTLLGV